MISAVITAGGISRRFGANKLLEITEGKSVIEHTILKFLPYCDEIVIPATVQTREFIENCDTYKTGGGREKITFVSNGETRQKSVYNALLACKYKDYVLIHDGARPFVEAKVIEDVIEKLKTQNALCCGIFATDTIKLTDDEGNIVQTLDRRKIFQAQTPQAFKYDLILRAHNEFKHRDDFTDDSSLVEALGIKVFAFVASTVNKKITTRADL